MKNIKGYKIAETGEEVILLKWVGLAASTYGLCVHANGAIRRYMCTDLAVIFEEDVPSRSELDGDPEEKPGVKYAIAIGPENYIHGPFADFNDALSIPPEDKRWVIVELPAGRPIARASIDMAKLDYYWERAK